MYDYLDFNSITIVKETKKDPAEVTAAEIADSENLFSDLLETHVPKYTSEPVNK